MELVSFEAGEISPVGTILSAQAAQTGEIPQGETRDLGKKWGAGRSKWMSASPALTKNQRLLRGGENRQSGNGWQPQKSAQAWALFVTFLRGLRFCLEFLPEHEQVQDQLRQERHYPAHRVAYVDEQDVLLECPECDEQPDLSYSNHSEQC